MHFDLQEEVPKGYPTCAKHSSRESAPRRFVTSAKGHPGAKSITTIVVAGWRVEGRVLSDVRSFTIRFFGPSSDHLTLRLVHHSAEPENYFLVNRDEYKHPIPCSNTLVLEDVKIWNVSTQCNLSSELQVLTFVPGSWNTLQFDVFGTSRNYALRDIELLDQDGLVYQPAGGGMEGSLIS